MKKNFFIILFFILFLALAGFATGTEIEYPSVPHAVAPTDSTTFPEYAKYLVNFSLTVSGIVALGVLVWAGFLYLTSAGNLSQMEDAKRKIIGSLLGLAIIIGSYVILYTINPQLVKWGLGPTEPEEGIYLIDSGGGRHFINDTTEEFSYSNITAVEFVSPIGSLLAVYLYDSKNFEGGEERVVNPGSGSVISTAASDVKSIYFLWNRPGVYLCPTTPSGSPWYICPTRPLYTVSDIADLNQYSYGSGTYDDEIESIQIIEPPQIKPHPAGDEWTYYSLVLFDQPNYTSKDKCPFSLVPSPSDTDVGVVAHIDDLDQPDVPGGFNNDPPIGKNKLSSLIVTLHNPNKQVSGKVTFFDKENCLPGASVFERSIPTFTVHRIKSMTGLLEGNWDNRIRSFRISGTGGVVLASDNNLTGRCRYFTYQGGSDYEVDSSRCVTRLPTEICDPNNVSTCPSSLIILPLPE